MFDLAAVAEHHGVDYVVRALRQCGADRCEAALKVADAMNPDFAKGIIGQLLYRDKTAHLIKAAQFTTQTVLRSTL